MGSIPENAEIFGHLWEEENFNSKINLNDKEDDGNEAHRDDDDDDNDENGEEEEEEFSFASAFSGGSLISAEDIFKDGQIRPLFPLFNQDLLYSSDLKEDNTAALRSPLKKLFVSNTSDVASPSGAEGPYCDWRGKAVEEASPEVCRKSYSTGFSKLWRLRDRVVRSSSDGKDAFVFLNHQGIPSSASSNGRKQDDNKTAGEKVGERVKKVGGGEAVAKKVKQGSKTASLSAHEKHYMMNRARKEGDRRKSYLPYKQDLVGFFANVNGFSRNVHPF